MKPTHEFKKSLTLFYSYIAVFILLSIPLLYWIPKYKLTLSIILIIGLIISSFYFLTLKHERIFLYEEFMAIRSIFGVDIIYYKTIQSLRININPEIDKTNAISIECVDENNRVIGKFHPSLLKDRASKEFLYSYIQKQQPVLFFERNNTYKPTPDEGKNITKILSLILSVLSISLISLAVLPFI